MKPITPELLAKIHAAARQNKSKTLDVISVKNELTIKKDEFNTPGVPKDTFSTNTESPGETGKEKSDTDHQSSTAEEVLNDLDIEELLESSKPPIENGIYEVKNDQDKLVQTLPYANGKLQGEGQVFNDNGNLVQTVSYVNGKKEGPLKIYTDQGQLLSIIPYQNDQRSGIGVFYVLGSKTAEMTFHHDVLEGLSVFYHRDGSIAAILNYKNNMLEGKMECFDTQQCLVRSAYYQAGKLQGESLTFYPGGIKIFEKGLFDQDTPIGKHWKFYEDEHILSLQEYDQGKLIKEQYYDPQGNSMEKPKGTPAQNPLPISFPNIGDTLHSF